MSSEIVNVKSLLRLNKLPNNGDILKVKNKKAMPFTCALQSYLDSKLESSMQVLESTDTYEKIKLIDQFDFSKTKKRY